MSAWFDRLFRRLGYVPVAAAPPPLRPAISELSAPVASTNAPASSKRSRKPVSFRVPPVHYARFKSACLALGLGEHEGGHAALEFIIEYARVKAAGGFMSVLVPGSPPYALTVIRGQRL